MDKDLKENFREAKAALEELENIVNMELRSLKEGKLKTTHSVSSKHATRVPPRKGPFLITQPPIPRNQTIGTSQSLWATSIHFLPSCHYETKNPSVRGEMKLPPGATSWQGGEELFVGAPISKTSNTSRYILSSKHSSSTVCSNLSHLFRDDKYTHVLDGKGQWIKLPSPSTTPRGRSHLALIQHLNPKASYSKSDDKIVDGKWVFDKPEVGCFLLSRGRLHFLFVCLFYFSGIWF